MIEPPRKACAWFALLACTFGSGACGDAELAAVEPAPGTVVPPFTVRGRWPDASALRYRVLADGGPVDAGTCLETVERALAVWSETGCVGFVRAQGEATDVIFRWGRASDPESPFGRDTSVAATGPLGADCTVQFDAGRAWRESGGVGPSLFQAAVHETGHALGLGHSEDPACVMNPQRETGRTTLGASDLAGLHSIYGGGEDRPGDLLIESSAAAGHRRLGALRGVAPPGAAEWTIFDTDGDGDDEVLVWSTAPRALGALTVYHFTAGARLERTLGPLLGVGGAGVRLDAYLSEQGERILEARRPDGTLARWRLDAGGYPHAVEAPTLDAPAPGASRSEGDLDGSGEFERVRRSQ